MIGRILYLSEFVFLIIILAGCSQKDKAQEEYEDYLKKIWVVEDWHGEEYEYHARFAFTITKMEDQKIEGNYGSFYRYSKVKGLGNKMTGDMGNGVIRCILYDDSGLQKIGILELINVNSRRIEGIIRKEKRKRTK